MKYLPLVLAGLWRRPMRTVLTFAAILAAFMLFGILAGLDAGFDHALRTARLDRLFVDSRFAGLLPLADADAIARVPGVTVVAPRRLLPGYYQDPKNRIGIIMTDARFLAVRPEFTATKAQIAALEQTRTGAIIGDYVAAKFGWKVGDKVPVISTLPTNDGNRTWTFDIVAVISNSDAPGQGNFFLGNYNYFDQRLLRDKGRADRFMLIIKDPAQAVQTGRTIDRLFANSPNPTRTTTERSASQSNLRSLGDVSFLTHAVIGAVLFMLLFLTANTMMQSVRERVPEFAVLKTLGFSDLGVLALVVTEAALLCLVGGALGLALVRVTGPAYSRVVPNVAGLFLLTWPSFFAGLGVALLTALAASIMPAWRVKKLNVVDALRR